MIRGIVQYEVFTFNDGRWQLSGRYPGAQREEAIKEAGHLEFVTGKPTKVIKDTYYPETNRNEELTAYLSPKGRALRAVAIRRISATGIARRDLDPISGRVKRPVTSPPRVAMRPRHRNTRAEMTVRIIVAIGTSLLYASIVTAVISTIFSQVAKVVTSIPPDTGNMVIAGTYLLVFLYTFPRTFRRRGRIHQIILEMWQNTAKPIVPKPVLSEKQAPRPRRKKERPWDLMRFDTPPPPPALDQGMPVEPPPTIEPVIAKAPPPPPPPPPVIDLAQERAKIEAEKAKAEAEKAKKEAEKKQQPAAPELPPLPPSPAAATPTTEDSNGFKLERIVLRRFAVDVVVPTVARAHRDDPVTRRGMALVLAGAVQGLGETTKISEGAATSLLTDALLQTGTKRPSVENFLANYKTHIASPAAAPLLAAGKTAIKKYAEGGSNISQLLLDALTMWRFPGMAKPVTQRVSYYLLSECQPVVEDGVDSLNSVPLHNTTARMAVLERGGEVVAHEGSGIFARFTDEEIARTTAEAIRASIATIAGLSVLVAVTEYAQPASEGENAAAALEQARIALRLSAATDIAGEPTPFETATAKSPVAPEPASSPPPSPAPPSPAPVIH